MEPTRPYDEANAHLLAYLCTHLPDILLSQAPGGATERPPELTEQNADDPAILAQWSDLTQRLHRPPDDAADWLVRHDDPADSDAAAPWWDDWAEPEQRYVCPVGRCSRTLPPDATVPRCWLFAQQMRLAIQP
jgi:hypothetical protein